jgi:hypothetical protein
MNNLAYRQSRGTDKSVDLSQAKEEWKKICAERETNGYKDCGFEKDSKYWKMSENAKAKE